MPYLLIYDRNDEPGYSVVIAMSDDATKLTIMADSLKDAAAKRNLIGSVVFVGDVKEMSVSDALKALYEVK